MNDNNIHRNPVFYQFNCLNDQGHQMKPKVGQRFRRFCLSPLQKAKGYVLVDMQGDKVKNQKVMRVANRAARIAYGILAFTLWLPFTAIGALSCKVSKSNKKSYAALTAALSYKQVEKNFWNTIGSDENIRRHLQLANVADWNNDTKELWKGFVDHVQRAYPDVVTEEAKGKLVDSLCSRFPHMHCYRLRAEGSSQVKSEVKAKLRIYTTKTFGWMAFHALIGTPQGTQYECDAKATAQAFKKWLQEEFDKGELPEGTKAILTHYFHYPQHAPEKLREDIIMKSKVYGIYSEEENEKRLERFLKDKKVFKSYLKHMNPYLVQDQLADVAKYFHKTIHLYQPSSFDGKEGDMKCTILNEGASDPAVVWHDGFYLYEHAELI